MPKKSCSVKSGRPKTKETTNIHEASTTNHNRRAALQRSSRTGIPFMLKCLAPLNLIPVDFGRLACRLFLRWLAECGVG